MIEKNKILESWIMVERLTEGDIDIKNRNLRCIDKAENQDYYDYIIEETKKLAKPKKGEDKRGFIIYFDIFEFNKTLDILRDKYSLNKTFEEIKVGDKFSFSLSFWLSFALDTDKFFITASAYINEKGDIPEDKEFEKYSYETHEQIKQIFNNAEKSKAEFNLAMTKVFETFKIDPKDCRLLPVGNLEKDAVNMHSFFINDLERALGSNNPNLQLYLHGTKKARVNLDSKRADNHSEFINILSPENYNLGRYPSKTEYSLAFMQQVAVNLACKVDTQNMRSVNGPPGTGKTTLLKDIFAELLVQQASMIISLNSKKLKNENERIPARLPDSISENNIIVASSNNGAVQNIVNELPLLNGIDGNLKDEIIKADYFYNIANLSPEDDEETINKQEFWGLYSLEGGKKGNMFNLTGRVKNVAEELDSNYIDSPEVYDGFKQSLEKVHNLRKRAISLAESLEELEKLIDLLPKQIEQEQEQLDQLKKNKPKWFPLSIKKYNKQLLEKQDSISKKKDELNKYYNNLKELRESKNKLLDMSLDYEQIQRSNPWYDEDYRIAQSELFISALKVRKQFLFENRKNIRKSLGVWWKQKEYSNHPEYIRDAWNWINFVVPVISTTFASFGQMFQFIPENSLGHLFVDEAGQALPQAAVGAILKSRQIMVVGDPSQIKPVLTLDSSVLSMIRDKYGVSEKYLSDSSSVQTLVDSASQYGYYRDSDCDENSWIGIPLWVHRRCKDPMFSISNRISYGGNMVFGEGNPDKTRGRTGWFDVKGKANDKYVEEQGEFVYRKIKEMIELNSDIIDSSKKDIIYVISPFSNVATKLAKKLDKLHFTRRDKNNKPTNIGTVHTFQGKEAKIVFFVLGADNQSKGAASWAVSEANIMNVAATRAKEEFYIVGDKDMYRNLGSEVIDDTYEVMNQYRLKFPDLYCDEVFEPAEPSQSIPEYNNRITGTVTTVGKGKKSYYAYISGDDGKKYTVSENIYQKVESADSVIVKGNRISFSILKNKYAIDIELI